MANVFRLAACSRRQTNVIRVRMVQALDPASPGGREVTPNEWADIEDALDAQTTYATLVDINDARGKTTYPERVKALNDEYDAWLERLPVTPPPAA